MSVDSNKVQKSQSDNDEKYRIFKQLVKNFYHMTEQKEKNEIINTNLHFVKIEPKFIYNSFEKKLKVEFKIGDTQMYKLKNLPEFYERMLKNENYKYGTKLEFTHTEEAFDEQSIPLLKYVLKYAEIIKYANETSGSYSYFKNTIEDGFITISNSGLDEIFDILKEKNVNFYKEYVDTKIYFKNTEPEIKFNVVKQDENEYALEPNIDVYEYEIIEGKDYLYFLYHNVLYKCGKNFENTVLKMLETFKVNYTNKIMLRKQDLPKLFSIIFPKLRTYITFNELTESETARYVPKELFVKLYLDFNKQNYVVCDVRFVYDNVEFNPLLQEDIDIPRDIAKENEVLEIFMKTGFMLDKLNSRLILADEEKIYQFLSEEIEVYMQKFEVLATDNFKHKEIHIPKLGSLGIRMENNLLHVDFSNLDFSIQELSDIMKKYHLKKKYHRLKDGSFLSLEQNDTMQFIDALTDKIDIDYGKIEKGELTLPIYRSMYLDKLLQNMQNTNIIKNGEYKDFVKNINDKEIDENIQIPKGLKADLRNYQKVGVTWLKLLDRYGLSGILADDMGLGKTVQMLAVILSYIEEEKDPKPSMVVCPSSLALNWDSEIKKFAPSLKTLVIHGGIEDRGKQLRSIQNYNIIITSYDLLKRDIDIYKELGCNFKYVIADEAQYIKNNNTQNAKAIKEISSETRYALTGTPIENSLSELWSIFDFIMPGYLFKYKKFKEL